MKPLVAINFRQKLLKSVIKNICFLISAARAFEKCGLIFLLVRHLLKSTFQIKTKQKQKPVLNQGPLKIVNFSVKFGLKLGSHLFKLSAFCYKYLEHIKNVDCITLCLLFAKINKQKNSKKIRYFLSQRQSLQLKQI